MSKDIKNTHLGVVEKPDSTLAKLADANLFTPTPAHRKLKAKFWARFVPAPGTDNGRIGYDDAVHVTNDPRLKKLWEQPGFKDWFTNRDENRERLEYLFSLSLDTAEEILVNPDLQPAAKVNMIKVLAELANKFPNRWQQERFVDDEINKMNELQLRAYLERRGISPAMTQIQLPPTSEAINADYTATFQQEETEAPPAPPADEDKGSR